MTKSFLEEHIRLNLSDRHVTRSFNHDLDTTLTGLFGQFSQQKQFLETDHAKDPSKVRIIEEVYQQLDHIRDPQKRYELALEKGLRLHQVTQQEIEAAKRPQSNIMNAFSQQGMMQHPSYTLPQANAPKSPFDVRPVEERFADAKQLAQDRRKAYFSQGVVSQRNPGV